MTALSAARVTKSKNLGPVKRYPVAASSTIYAGGMVMIDSAGYARAAAASVNNTGVVGVATTTVANTGAAGAAFVNAQSGWFLFAADSIAQTSLGLPVYADDDQTVDETQASNAPVVGILLEVVSSSSAWVAIGQTIASAIEATN